MQSAQAIYTDFSAFGELKKAAREKSPEAIKQVAQQFESLFVQMMLKSMRDTVPENELFGGVAVGAGLVALGWFICAPKGAPTSALRDFICVTFSIDGVAALVRLVFAPEGAAIKLSCNESTGLGLVK